MANRDKIINLFPIVSAFFFLFNPNITVIDPLPDFIGYIILCTALYKVSDIHERIGEAYSSFKKMIFIDAGKWLAVFWVFGMTVPSERNASLLLWTFVFAVFEMIFVFPAYVKLFDGITQLGYLYPSNSIFKNKGKRSRTDKIRNLTVAFVFLKAILTFLPELSDLTSSTYDEGMSGFIDLYRYIGLMRTMAFIPVFIVGVIWFLNIVSYFRAVTNDREFMNALSDKYETAVRPKTGLFIRRSFATVTLITTIALFLTVDIRIDDYNMIPDILAAILFIIAFVFISKHNLSKTKRWIFPTAVFSCFSILSSVCEYAFFSRYYYGAIIKSDEARNMYIIVIVINALKVICQLGVFVELYRSLITIIHTHTGFVVGRERTDDREQKMVKTVHNELKKGVKMAFAISVGYMISDICFDIFAPRIDFMGLINIVFAIACLGMFLRAFSDIQNAIDTKYMLE